MPEILFISYYWPPSGGPGVQRCVKFVKYLTQMGANVTVLTVDENRATYPLRDETLLADVPPTVKVHTTNTLEIFGLYSMLLGKKGKGKSNAFVNEKSETFFQKLSMFIRGNFFIPDARVGWNRFAIAEGKKILKSGKIDLIITSGPPHSTHLIGLALKEKFKTPWIADLRDPWTDIYYYDSLMHLPFVKKIDASLERKVLQNADTVITVTEYIKQLLVAKGASAKQTVVIPNGFDEDDFKNVQRTVPEKGFVITLTGTISSGYRIDEFLRAFKTFSDKYPVEPMFIQFVGKVGQGIQDKAQELGMMANIKLIDYVPHKEAINYMASSDALLMGIVDTSYSKGATSGKIFEYLAIQKPIICVGPTDGIAAEIINECEAGKTFSYEQYDEMLAYFIYLYERKNTPQATSENRLKYSRKKLTEELFTEIKKLVKSN